MLKLSSSISLQHSTAHWPSHIFQWLTVIYLFFVSAPSLLSILTLMCLIQGILSLLCNSPKKFTYTFSLSLDICFCLPKGWHWQEVTERKDDEVTSPWLPSSLSDWGSCLLLWIVNPFQGTMAVFLPACP